jgi:transcriptional regulator with XRE-family HTH domain
MPKVVSESQQFADRLRSALESAGVRASPTLVANAFNLRYHGRSITPHTARNWLLGKVMPTQDKLRVLAEWLQVSPDELRFGRAPGKTYVYEMNAGPIEMALADREMIDRYLSLSQAERKTIRDVVSAFVLAKAAEKCVLSLGRTKARIHGTMSGC